MVPIKQYQKLHQKKGLQHRSHWSIHGNQMVAQAANKWWSSVARLDDFWNFLATNFITKVAQMFGDFWAVVKTIAF